MNKYVEIIKLIEKIFGKDAVSKSLGTRTNIVRFPKGKQGLDPTRSAFDVEATSQTKPHLVDTIKNSIEDRIGDLSQMNDSELIMYKGNLQRLDNVINPPSADIVEAGSKQREIKDVLKDFGIAQTHLTRMHDEGLVRATARQILLNDIKSGKIKNISASEAINMKEPLDPFRQIYGEGALEQLDSLIPEFRGLKTEKEAEELARSKFKFDPDENRLPGSVSMEEGREAEKKFGINKPKEPEVVSIKSEADKRKSIDDLIDEYNANQDRLLLTDEEGGTLITYPEFNKLKNRNDEIAKVLEEKGIKSTPEVEVKPEGIVIPFKKKPEEFAEGGYAGLDYLMGFDNRPGYAGGGDVKKILDIIAKANKQLKGKKSMETVNPKTGEVTIPKNPIKTAERQFIDYDAMNAANELSLKHKEAAYAFDQIQPIDIYDKIAADRVAEIMAEIKGKDYYDLSQKQRSVLYKKAQSFLDDYIKIDRINKAVKKFNAGEELQAIDERYLSKFLPESGVTFESKVKPPYKQGDIITEENFGSTPFAPSQETLDNLEKARKMSSEMSLEQRMNKVLNQYDKSMFIKNEEGMVDVTNPENIEKMALLLKRDHPELYNQIFNLGEDLSQKQQLLDFDVTGRKPNKDGGLNYLLGL